MTETWVTNPSEEIPHQTAGFPQKSDDPSRRRRQPVLDGDWPLARLAAARIPRTASRTPAQARANPVRPPPHPNRLRHPAFGRGLGTVPGAGKRGARRGAATQPRVSGVGHAGNREIGG